MSANCTANPPRDAAEDLHSVVATVVDHVGQTAPTFFRSEVPFFIFRRGAVRDSNSRAPENDRCSHDAFDDLSFFAETAETAQPSKSAP